MSESHDLPTSAFDTLLPKLIAILELTQPSEGDLTPQARQALLLAVCVLNHYVHRNKLKPQITF
jgi:hypothetical protein